MRLRFRESNLFLIPAILCLLLSVQCSDDPVAPEPPAPPLPTSVSKVIDETGGELRLRDEAWVVIPPGALDSALTVTISKTAKLLPPANHVLATNGYSFTPHLYAFNDSITLGVSYDATAGTPSMVRLDDDTDHSWDVIANAACVDGIATCKSETFSILSVTNYRALDEVYVSPTSRGPFASGTRDDPLPTITAGIDASLGAGEPYPPVYVATGVYEEDIELAGGVSIHGGYDVETWEPSFGAYSIVDALTAPATAKQITTPTKISGLDFHAQDATDPSANSVALHVVSCSASLNFERCRFQAGDAATGARGVNGTKGARGGNGKDGSGAGGGAGGSGCYGGGAGGIGFPVAGIPGGKGAGPNGGLGGLGGILIPYEVELFGNGQPGLIGGNGSIGQHGSAGTPAGTGTIDGWSSTTGGEGTDGTCGSGGGGGGGGTALVWPGGGGGGGGGGGHGGIGAEGGRGGGSSFAVYLYESAPVFENCEFVSGAGGTGGAGGNGGDGGDGGLFGMGALYALAEGGRGSWGGDGGDAGGGGGGAGGHSYCVCRVGATSMNVTMNNPIFIVGTAGTGGLGGKLGADGQGRAPQGNPGTSGEMGNVVGGSIQPQ